MENHDMTQRAQMRMQQLIAMLRHKTGDKHLILTEPQYTSMGMQTEKDAGQDSDARHNSALRTVTVMDSEGRSSGLGENETPKKEFSFDNTKKKAPQRFNSLDEAALAHAGYGPNGLELNQFKDIERQITQNMTKFKSGRDKSRDNRLNLNKSALDGDNVI